MSEQLNLDEIRARQTEHQGKWAGVGLDFSDVREMLTDIPALLALVDRLTARVGELEAEKAASAEAVEGWRLIGALMDDATLTELSMSLYLGRFDVEAVRYANEDDPDESTDGHAHTLIEALREVAP